MMKLDRKMKLTECEIKEIIENGKIDIPAGSSWSGEQREDSFIVADHFYGMEIILHLEVDEELFERPENYEIYQQIYRLNQEGEDIPDDLEEYTSDAKCDEALDEWINKEDMICYISAETLKDVEEDGFDAWLGLQDTGYIDIEVII